MRACPWRSHLSQMRACPRLAQVSTSSWKPCRICAFHPRKPSRNGVSITLKKTNIIIIIIERGGEVELARGIGEYLARGLQSRVWDKFFHATQGQARLYKHFRALRGRPYSAATVISMSAIYVYWRVEQQLLDPTLRKLLDRWQGDDIRGHLEKILDSFSLQGMEEEAIKQELKF
jgi:hypothetical protein